MLSIFHVAKSPKSNAAKIFGFATVQTDAGRGHAGRASRMVKVSELPEYTNDAVAVLVLCDPQEQ
jgi:hypothetical protein